MGGADVVQQAGERQGTRGEGMLRELSFLDGPRWKKKNYQGSILLVNNRGSPVAHEKGSDGLTEIVHPHGMVVCLRSKLTVRVLLRLGNELIDRPWDVVH